MLVVKVELWPFGDDKQAHEIERAYIYNDGGGDHMYGNYVVTIHDRTHADVPPLTPGIDKYTVARGRLSRYPRSPRNLWPLIRDALKSCRLRTYNPTGPSHGAKKE